VVLPESEHAPLPVNLLTPHGRLAVPKVRAFVDFVAPRLRQHFDELSLDSID
jgi:DNA-binding transcriptional LysR family regulator